MNNTTQSALDALSEKATQGEWEVQEPIDIGLMIVEAGKEAYEWRGIADLLFPDERGDIPRKQVIANAAFIVALVNAYRTGHLTVADPAAIAAAEARGREAGLKLAAGVAYLECVKAKNVALGTRVEAALLALANLEGGQ